MSNEQGGISGLEDLLRDMESTSAVESQVLAELETETVTLDGSAEEPDAETAVVNMLENEPETQETAPAVEVAPPKAAGKGKNKRKGAQKAKGKVVAPAATPDASEGALEGSGEPASDDAEPVAPKAPVDKRVFFGRDKLGRLEHRLGAELSVHLLLDVGDVDLGDDDLAAKVAANKAMFKGLAVKVQNRATNVIEFISGKAKRLNPVVELALRLLSKDRQIVTGDKGNLYVKMSGLYTEGAARAMGNSTLGALKALKIVTESGAKQTFVPNEESALLALLSSKMLLSFVDVNGILDDVVAQETQDLQARADAQASVEAAALAAAVVTPVADPAQPATVAELVATVVKQAEDEKIVAIDAMAELEAALV